MTFPDAIAIIGSVIVVCGTAIKIFSGKRAEKSIPANEDSRVLSVEIQQLRKDVDRLHDCVDKIQENFIKLLGDE